MQTLHPIIQNPRTTLVIFLIYLLHSLSTVSSLDTLNLGQNLSSSSQLVSANGVFTLGFHTPQDTNNTYLALWFTDPAARVVWIGKRQNPIPTNSTHLLTVGPRGELIITQQGGESIELYAGGSSGQRNVTAVLLDSGNFVVKLNGSSSFLWQSFGYPTDTLLAGMKMGLDRRTGRNWTLSSWFGPSNPAPGPFTLEWDPITGNFIVRFRGEVYWRSGELKYYTDEQGKSRVDLENFGFNRDPYNFFYNFTKVVTDDEDYIVFSVLPALKDEWKFTAWRLDYEGDIMDVLRSISIERPSLCYNYYDKKSSVIRGCELREQPECRNGNQQFVFKSGSFRPDKGQLEQTFDNNSSHSLSDCREVCWDDCECVAYYVSASSGCGYLRGKNLEYVQSVDGSVARMYFLESPSSTKGLKKHVKIILIVLGLMLLLVLGITLFVVRKLRKGKREEEVHELLTLDGYTEGYELENGGGKSNDLKLFAYASVQTATNNFSSGNKLGQGGFGPVYKGKTSEGQDIAVKLLSRQSGQGLLEFKTELVLISKLQHVNLVKLLGFCIHGDDKMIIYEYMRNRSLDFFLFNPSKREQLDWQKRFNIIEGTAQGLLYLHKYSRLKIIHRDLNPNNILLDENMNPKISDFGLARIFKQNASEANTNRRVGTYGYMAPEYAMQGIFSVKSDVYSFGVLVLEIVSGRKNNSFHQIEGPLNLVEYAWELWRKDSAIELMDPTLKESCVMGQLQRCIHIGLLCVENQAVDRPTIEDVITMFKNETTTLPLMPKNPAFITRHSVVEEVEKGTAGKVMKVSTNGVTVSEMQGR